MSKRTEPGIVKIPITPELMKRFHELAPAAVASRSGGFIFEQVGVSIDLVLMGLIPTLGMIFFQWSAAELLGFLLLGTWISIIGEIIRYAFLWKPVNEYAARLNDHWFIWGVVEALRGNKKEVSRASREEKFHPGIGIFFDLVPGGVATIMLALMFSAKKPQLYAEITSSTPLRYSLLIFASWQALQIAFEIVDYWIISGQKRVVKPHAGIRGIALFLFLFLALIVMESMKKDVTVLVHTTNAFFIFLGVVNALGIFLMRSETEWLRKYLSDKKLAHVPR